MTDCLSYDSADFCVFVFVFYHGLRHSIFRIKFPFFISLDKSFFVYHCKSSVMLYYFVLLLKQTSEVKTLPFTMSHNFKTVGQPYLRQSVAGFSLQGPVFGHRSFHLAFAIQSTGTGA